MAFFRETGGKGWSSKIIQASLTSSSTPGGQNFTGKIELLEGKNCAIFLWQKLHRIKIFFLSFFDFFFKVLNFQQYHFSSFSRIESYFFQCIVISIVKFLMYNWIPVHNRAI